MTGIIRTTTYEDKGIHRHCKAREITYHTNTRSIKTLVGIVIAVAGAAVARNGAIKPFLTFLQEKSKGEKHVIGYIFPG